MKLFLLVLMTLLASTNITAQTWEYKDSGTTFLLYDVAIPEGQNDIAYAAGAQFTANSPGIIIKSTDGGETWNTIYPVTGTVDGIEKIDFINETTGFAVGYDLFIKTEDGGASWQDIVLAPDVWVYKSLTFYDENIGIVTALTNGGSFLVYTTDDGGTTWNPITSSSNMPTFAVAYADATTLYAVGANEVISKSTNGGDTWVELQSGTPTFFYLEVFFKDADNGVVAGEDGQLLTTHDGGGTWDIFTTGYHNFYGLTYVGDDLYAAGTDQDVYKSEDNGATWTLVHNGENVSTFYDIEFFADNSALICGSQGRMLKMEPILSVVDPSESDQALKTSYNASENMLHINSSVEIISGVDVYAITGVLVHSEKYANTTVSLETSAFPKGIYLLDVHLGNEIRPVKFLKY